MPTTYTIEIVTKFENVSEDYCAWWLQRVERQGLRKDIVERIRLTGEGGFSTQNPDGDGIGTTTYKVTKEKTE